MKSNTIADYKIRPMQLADNQAVAALVRVNLENNGLDIAGTAYFDSTLDNLYEFYSLKDVAHGTMDHFYYKKLSD